MQAVGVDCVKCGNKITSFVEATGCPACSSGWHIKCLDKQDLCPQCEGELISGHDLLDAKDLNTEKSENKKKCFSIGLLAIFLLIIVIASLLLVSINNSSRRKKYKLEINSCLNYLSDFAKFLERDYSVPVTYSESIYQIKLLDENIAKASFIAKETSIRKLCIQADFIIERTKFKLAHRLYGELEVELNMFYFENYYKNDIEKITQLSYKDYPKAQMWSISASGATYFDILSSSANPNIFNVSLNDKLKAALEVTKNSISLRYNEGMMTAYIYANDNDISGWGHTNDNFKTVEKSLDNIINSIKNSGLSSSEAKDRYEEWNLLYSTIFELHDAHNSDFKLNNKTVYLSFEESHNIREQDIADWLKDFKSLNGE